jgi:hypothetical protein
MERRITAATPEAVVHMQTQLRLQPEVREPVVPHIKVVTVQEVAAVAAAVLVVQVHQEVRIPMAASDCPAISPEQLFSTAVAVAVLVTDLQVASVAMAVAATVLTMAMMATRA